MLSPIKHIIQNSPVFKALIKKVLSGENSQIIKLAGSLKSFLLALLLEESGRTILAVLPEEEEAQEVLDQISCITDKEIGMYPAGEEEPNVPFILNPGRTGMQTALLRNTANNNTDMVITTPEGFGYMLPDPDWFKEHCIDLSLGSSVPLYQLVEQLIEYGYTRESLVERPGEISLRGGILDIYPLTGEPPYRFEFFGNEIDSIRQIDIETQRSQETNIPLTIAPTPLFWEKRNSYLFSYLDNPLIFLQDQDLIRGKIDHTFHARESNFVSSEEVFARLEHYQTIQYHTLKAPNDCIGFGAEPLVRSGNKAQDIRDQLNRITRSYENIYIVSEDSSQRDRIRDLLNIDSNPIPDLQFIVDGLHRGFVSSSLQLAALSASELLGRKPVRRRKRKVTTGVPVRELTDLKQGDYVVHIDHGIGIYKGLEKITVKESARECLKIAYQEEDILYVSVDKMQRVQKYSGREGVEPAINKLGSSKWEKTKQKTKESVRKITQNLINLYSERQAISGYAFSEDTVWQQELEDSFAYQETMDQKEAIKGVKRNMESPQPMDRLVSGDVGFGKTEVAIRAAFKAVNDSKQVAIIVPTTILAQQHFSTFKERLSRYPVRIEVLSRFRSKSKQKEIIKELQQGTVDVVIGTHRLLSSDVDFKDLGLLIIDEEHRFGVKHKEKIKILKRNVDVLAMSATPIPRTLQFSLLGIRDMSQINTPPEQRLPIITEVLPFHEQIIIEAVQREVNRGGQVFFVYNRVKSIHAAAEMIKRLIPEVRLGVAHGQMKEKDLEKVMIEFGEKKYDCLISTMIIESGLDLPNANTLIVHRADRLGLGQLYQLRGRVGRSDKRAYAYLLTPPFHLLTKDALRRLRTIEEFTELGSGLQIALRDLEIRGAGSLLGVKQSGNIEAVGFDLYMKLVNETVKELKQETRTKKEEIAVNTECTVEVELPAYIPDTYVGSEGQRVNMYRSLAAAQSLKQITEIQDTLRDRFGVLPQECINLLEVARIRIFAGRIGIERVLLTRDQLTVFFHRNWTSNFITEELLSKKLSTMVNSSPVPVHFIHGEGFGAEVSIKEKEPFTFTKKILQCWT